MGFQFDFRGPSNEARFLVLVHLSLPKRSELPVHLHDPRDVNAFENEFLEVIQVDSREKKLWENMFETRKQPEKQICAIVEEMTPDNVPFEHRFLRGWAEIAAFDHFLWNLLW